MLGAADGSFQIDPESTRDVRFRVTAPPVQAY